MLRWEAVPGGHILVALILFGSICIAVERRLGRLPNEVTFIGVVAGVAIGFVFGGLEGLQRSLFGLATGGILIIPGYLIGSVGGGSVKLSAAFGAIGGSAFTVLSLIVAALLVIALKLIVIGFPLLSLEGSGPLRALHVAWVGVLSEKSRQVVPLGTAISTASVLLGLFAWLLRP